MNIKTLFSRFKEILDKRRIFRDLFTPWFILKNSIILNYCILFKKNVAPPTLNIDMKITNKCNGNCYFCYSKNIKSSNKELTTNEWKSFIESFGKQKKAFYITGGEPFLRKDIFEIIKAIKKQGSYCGIVTNGTLLSYNDLKKIIDLEVDNIVFSLHGLAETHNKILKVNNAFEKVTGVISELSSLRKKNKRKKPYIMVNYVINCNVKKETRHLIKLCNKFGVDEIRFAHPSFLFSDELKEHKKVGRKLYGSEVPSSQYITKKVDFIFKNKYINNKLKIRVSTYPNLSNHEILSWYSNNFITKRKCFYIYSSCFINESGEVYPCHFYPFSFGNIKKDKLNDIWNNKKYIKFRKVINKSLLPGCSRCCKLF